MFLLPCCHDDVSLRGAYLLPTSCRDGCEVLYSDVGQQTDMQHIMIWYHVVQTRDKVQTHYPLDSNTIVIDVTGIELPSFEHRMLCDSMVVLGPTQQDHLFDLSDAMLA